MTESSSPSAEELDKAFVIQALLVYREAAGRSMSEAEELICRGIEFRQQALMLLNRAAELAKEYGEQESARQESCQEVDW